MASDVGRGRYGGGGSHRVSRARSDVGHNSDDNVLLDGEWAGVEGDTEDLYAGNESGPSAHEGEGDQLRHNLYVATHERRSVSTSAARGSGHAGRGGEERRHLHR